MNKDIKFRGKRKLNGDWVHGYYYFDTDENFGYIVNNDDGDLTKYRVIPETVGQYIGKIKTEQEVYTGDIIKHGESIRFVEYRNGNTSATRMDKSETILLSFCESPRVIGNIHDHPEHFK